MSWFSSPSTPLVPSSNSAKSLSQELTTGTSEKKEAETSLSLASTSQSLPLQGSTLLVLGKDFAVKAKGRTKSSRMKDDGTTFSLERPFFPRPMSNESIYRFTQMVSVATIASSTSVTTFSGQAFTASIVDQISSLTAVFDQYRIDEIEVWFWPRVGASNEGATVDQGLFASVVDYDDAATLSSFSAALDYSNVVVTNGRDGHYRRFKPHCAVAAYSGAFSSFANVASPWIDAASTGVQHYGVKSVWTATDAVYSQSVQARYHMSWRNVR